MRLRRILNTLVPQNMPQAMSGRREEAVQDPAAGIKAEETRAAMEKEYNRISRNAESLSLHEQDAAEESARFNRQANEFLKVIRGQNRKYEPAVLNDGRQYEASVVTYLNDNKIIKAAQYAPLAKLQLAASLNKKEKEGKPFNVEEAQEEMVQFSRELAACRDDSDVMKCVSGKMKEALDYKGPGCDSGRMDIAGKHDIRNALRYNFVRQAVAEGRHAFPRLKTYMEEESADLSYYAEQTGKSWSFRLAIPRLIRSPLSMMPAAITRASIRMI